MAKKYAQIGAMIAKKDRETQNPILDANGKQSYYIKLDKSTKVTVENNVNGKITKVVLNGGDFINVNRPRDKADRMLEKGSLSESEHAEKIARYEKGGDLDYIQFELNASEEI